MVRRFGSLATERRLIIQWCGGRASAWAGGSLPYIPGRAILVVGEHYVFPRYNTPAWRRCHPAITACLHACLYAPETSFTASGERRRREGREGRERGNILISPETRFGRRAATVAVHAKVEPNRLQHAPHAARRLPYPAPGMRIQCWLL